MSAKLMRTTKAIPPTQHDALHRPATPSEAADNDILLVSFNHTYSHTYLFRYIYVHITTVNSATH